MRKAEHMNDKGECARCGQSSLVCDLCGLSVQNTYAGRCIDCCDEEALVVKARALADKARASRVAARLGCVA